MNTHCTLVVLCSIMSYISFSTGSFVYRYYKIISFFYLNIPFSDPYEGGVRCVINSQKKELFFDNLTFEVLKFHAYSSRTFKSKVVPCYENKMLRVNVRLRQIDV